MYFRQNKSKQVILIFLTLIWIGFIFSNSLKNSTESSEISNYVFDFAKDILSSINLNITTLLVRKAAHLIEFLILGILSLFTLSSFTPYLFKNLTIPLFIGLLTAVSDETIQLFSSGRSSEVKDILIDFLGFLIGIIISFLIIKLKQYRNKKNRQTIFRF